MSKALAELRQLRRQGKTRSAIYTEDSEDDSVNIYDELTDHEYRQLQRKRVREDDFVVDDNGEGYVDTGEYEWDEPADKESDEDMESMRMPSVKRQATQHKIRQTGPRDGNVSQLFRKVTVTPRPKPSKVRNDEIENIIGSIGRSAKSSRKPEVKLLRPPQPVFRRQPMLMDLSPLENSVDRSATGRHKFYDRTGNDSSTPETTIIADIPSEPDMHMDLYDLEFDLPPNVSNQFPQMSSGPSPLPSEPTSESTIKEIECDQVLLSAPADSDDSATVGISMSKFAKDGTVRLFWMGCHAIGNTLLLTGRVQVDTRYESVSVQVTNSHREVYFLPRPTRTVEDVKAEVIDKLNRAGLKNVATKAKKMRYCFGNPDIPSITEWLLVLVPADFNYLFVQNRMPVNNGKTYCQVFGACTDLAESFLVSKGIMGPCWLDVKQASEAANSTWCRGNIRCDSSRQISRVDEKLPPPSCSAMSISVRVVYNEETKAQEILTVSLRIYSEFPADAGQSNLKFHELPSLLLTGVCPHQKVFPPQFDDRVAKSVQQKGAKSIIKLKNEKQLLSWLITQIHRFDPDILLGHKLVTEHLPILANRFNYLSERQWSKFGRVRRSANLELKGKRQNEIAAYLTTGRLLCDLDNDMGRSLTGKCSSWSLSEMTELYLNESRIDQGVDVRDSRWLTQGADGLLSLIRHNENDTLLIMGLALCTQILPLTLQLTELAGNTWAQTLEGKPSQRNEYVLLHEFHRQDLICPDQYGSHRGDGITHTTRNKKAAYQGGLVFEPEIGFHQSFVLVMDFNSLYPSIIQEFNLCFTTTDLTQISAGGTEEHKPISLPPSGLPFGTLPRLIQTLVERRRTIKKHMKEPSATETQRAQWDIKQQALKLTANSMYGCLGQAGSRFEARALAELTTAQGREILRNTRRLAEAQGLKVIYGDTDSVMISTGVNDYSTAVSIGNDFKKLVNAQYSKLEIDIDHVFSAILLTNKKRYAAQIVEPGPDGKLIKSLEVKGLDMRRREFSPIAKDASQQVLTYIFSEESIDDSLMHIYDYLGKLYQDIQSNKVPIVKYLVSMQLNRQLKDYGDTANLPHVAVARRKTARGGLVTNGDIMTFLYVQGASNRTGRIADYARTLQEVKKEHLQVDTKYYLRNQILPCVRRLLEHVDGVDVQRICRALGLSEEARTMESTPNQREYTPFETSLDASERFQNVVPLKFTCGSGHEFKFEGAGSSIVGEEGIICPTCHEPLSISRLAAQLEIAVRSHIREYYKGMLQCGDAMCSVLTNSMSVFSRKCVAREGCAGYRRFVISDKDLFTQLSYFSYLVDSKQAEGLALRHKRLFDQLHHVLDKYLENCGRRYVNLGGIFKGMT